MDVARFCSNKDRNLQKRSAHLLPTAATAAASRMGKEQVVYNFAIVCLARVTRRGAAAEFSSAALNGTGAKSCNEWAKVGG